MPDETEKEEDRSEYGAPANPFKIEKKVPLSEYLKNNPPETKENGENK